jgi:beta-lactamase regulating signal transducer with metallopeptidase domain/HEAT repeat protein
MNSLIEILNIRGAQFLRAAWPMLWQSSILIALLFAVDFALRKRVRATVRYVLWTLVLVKLVLPTSLSLPTSVGYWVPPPQSLAAEMAMAPPDLEEVQNLRPITMSVATRLPQPAPAGPRKLPPPVLTWPGMVVATWFGGIAVLALVFLLRARQAHRIARRAARTNEFSELLSNCARQMGVRSGISLRLSDAVDTPAVCGLFHPVILLPKSLAGKLDHPQLRAVLLHELAHVRRGDLWVGHIQTALQIFYFYNPCLWLANAAIRRAREEAVDEMVLVAMADEAAVYPETLLSVARFSLQAPRLAFGFAGILESKSTLGARIRLMLQRPWPTSAKLGLRGAVALIILGLVMLPMTYVRRMPSYQGKTAEQWLGQISFPPHMDAEGFSEVIQAFIHMDGRGVTFLREELATGSRAQAEPGTPPALSFLRRLFPGLSIEVKSAAGQVAARQTKRQSPDFQTAVHNQAKAALVLKELGPAAEPALPELIAMIPEHSGIAGQYAILTLGAFGPKARAAVPALLAALTSNNQAAEALLKIDPNNPKLVPALIDALQGPRLNFKGPAAEALAQLGSRAKAAVPALRACLADAKKEMASEKMGAFVAAPYAEALLKIAVDQPDVLAEANAVFNPPPISLPDIEELIAAVEKAQAPAEPINDRAVQTVAGINRRRSNDYEMALIYLEGGIERAQEAGLQLPDTLIKERIMPLLNHALLSSDMDILSQACRLRRILGPVAAQGSAPLITEHVMPLLIQKLDLSETVEVLLDSCISLSDLGPMATRALPKLMAVFEKEDASNYRQAERRNELYAIRNIAPGDPATLPSLMRALDDADSGVRSVAIGGLGKFGPEAANAVPAIHKCCQALGADSWGVKFQATYALWHIAKEPPSLDILQEALRKEPNDKHHFFSLPALDMLGGLNEQTDDSKALIHQLAQSSSDEVRTNALALLEKIGEHKSAP